MDKYRPHDLQKLDFHKEQAKNLKKLTQQGDFPHLLVYGPPGAGKKTRIMCLLKELYGSGVERLRMEHMNFTTPSNKKLEIMTVSSNYHIEVNPSDVGIYDRIVIMDLIKNVAQSQQLDVDGQREFKVRTQHLESPSSSSFRLTGSNLNGSRLFVERRPARAASHNGEVHNDLPNYPLRQLHFAHNPCDSQPVPEHPCPGSYDRRNSRNPPNDLQERRPDPPAGTRRKDRRKI